MGGSAPSAPKSKPEKDIKKYVAGYTNALPSVLDAEKQYRPEFLDLNLRDTNTFLQGIDGQSGLYALGRTASQEAGQSITDARSADFASMTGQAGQFRGFAQALAPESRSQVDASSDEAAKATQAARQLTPEEKRMSDQASREAFASRGMLNSNASVGSEVLGRAGVMADKRQEAMHARTNAFDMAQQFYTAPGLQALGNAPLSYQMGQQQLGMGLGAIGSATPQMINPDAGVNLGSQDRANQTAAAGAKANADATRNAALLGAGTVAVVAI